MQRTSAGTRSTTRSTVLALRLAIRSLNVVASVPSYVRTASIRATVRIDRPGEGRVLPVRRGHAVRAALAAWQWLACCLAERLSAPQVEIP
jgi:hypothetical protein